MSDLCFICAESIYTEDTIYWDDKARQAAHPTCHFRLRAAAPEMADFLWDIFSARVSQDWLEVHDQVRGWQSAARKLLVRIRGEDQRPEGVANGSSK